MVMSWMNRRVYPVGSFGAHSFPLEIILAKPACYSGFRCMSVYLCSRCVAVSARRHVIHTDTLCMVMSWFCSILFGAQVLEKASRMLA